MKTNYPELVKTIEAGIATGLHPGAVVHVRQNGKIVADFAVGAADWAADTTLRPDHRILWLSAGKPLTALAVGILSDRGRVSFDAQVCNYISEFAGNGKDDITVRHLLSHTHAYRPPRLDWPRMSRDQVIEQICHAIPIKGETPGQYAAYDPQSGWYLLSEIVERVTGQLFHEFVKAEVLEPLGCHHASIGMDADKWTAARQAGELAVLYDTTRAARERINLGVEDGHFNEASVAQWVGDDAQRASAHNPGGGSIGTASDLAALYQCLLDDGKTPTGAHLLRNSTVEEMTTRQRIGMKDHSFMQVVDWGLGFLINSSRYGATMDPYGYGQHASDKTFGHGGMQSSSAYADPENGMAVAIIFNGLPGEPKHQKRVYEANSALYRDLGLST